MRLFLTALCTGLWSMSVAFTGHTYLHFRMDPSEIDRTNNIIEKKENKFCALE